MRKILVKQTENFNCGAACLEMIIEYYKGYIGIDRLSYMLEASTNGINAYNIVSLARKLGFESYGSKDIIMYPSIALIKKNNFYHYVVIYSKKKNLYLIADPDKGFYKKNITDFNEIYQNISLNFKPVIKLPILNKTKLIDFIKKIILNNKSLYLLICFISFIVLLISLLYSFFYKIIINNHSNQVLIYFLIVLLIKLSFTYINNLLTIKSNTIIDKSLTNDIIKKLITLPYMYFKNHTTGEVVNRFNDIFKVKELVTNLVLLLSLELPLFISCFIIIFIISKPIFIIILIISIIYILCNLLLNKKYVILLNKTYIKKDLLLSYLTDSLICYEGIKGCNKEEYVINTLNNKYNDYLNNTIKYNKYINNKIMLSQLIITIGQGLIIFIGIKNLNISNFLIINSLYIYVIDILEYLINVLTTIKDSNLSYKRIYELDINDDYGKIKKISNYDINYNNCNFSYGNNLIINNFSLNIKYGEKIFICGPSGKGKSTIFKLLKKYYKTNNLIIGNNNINSYNKEALNKIIYVGQNETLYSDTLYNNLMCDNSLVNKYINMLYVNEIMTKNNSDINMLLLDQGFNLSGGEKQRIVLLRAILNDFEILIIDEALSQVDNYMERNIIKKLLKEFNKKTIIFISHRLDNKDLFDRIINI